MTTARIAPDGNDLLVYTLDETGPPYLNSAPIRSGDGLPNLTESLPAGQGRAAPGIFGNAVYFSRYGNLQYYLTSGDTSLGETPAYACTLSFWIKPLDFNNWSGIVIKEYHAPSNWQYPYFTGIRLDDQNSGGLNIFLAVGGTYNSFKTDPNNNYTPGRILTNVWNHVGFTYDGSYIRAYINGNMVASAAETRPLDWGTHGAWRLGDDAYDTTFNFLLDDVRVAGVVRDDAWFASVYNGIPPIQVASDNDDQLVYTLDETAAPFANSAAMGPVLPLSVVNTVTVNQAGAYPNSRGVRTSGNGNSYLDSGNTALAEYPSPISMSCWVLPIGWNGWAPFFCKEYWAQPHSWDSPYFTMALSFDDHYNGGWYVNLGVGAGVRLLVRSDITNASGSNRLNQYWWNHVGFTYDGSYIRLYQNGRLVNCQPETRAIDWGTHGAWRIGGDLADASCNCFLDDCRFAAVARPASWFAQVWAGINDKDASYLMGGAPVDNTHPLGGSLFPALLGHTTKDGTFRPQTGFGSGVTYYRHRGLKLGTYYFWEAPAPDPTGALAPTTGLSDIVILKVYQR